MARSSTGTDQARTREQRTAVIFVAATVGSAVVSTLANHVVAGRLDAASMDDLLAFTGALTAVGFFALGLRLALVAWLGTRSDVRLPRPVVRAVVIGGLAIAVAAGVTASRLVTAGPEFEAAVGVAFGASVAAILWSSCPLAELLAAERWRRLGALIALGMVVRGFGLAIPWSTSSPGRVMVPVALGEIAAAVAAFAIRPADAPTVRGRGVPQVRRVLSAVLSVTGLLAYLSFSTVAFRSRLGADASTFNQSASISKLVIFAPLSVSLLFFPAMARNRLGSPELRRALRNALVSTCSLSLLATVGLFVAPTQLASLLLADGSRLDVAVARVLSLACLATSIAMVAVLLAIAHGSKFALAPWPAAIVVVVGQLRASSPGQLANFVLMGAALLLIVVAIPAVQRAQPVLHPMVAPAEVHPLLTDVGVTVVIPNFNAGRSVLDTIERTHDHLTHLGVPFTVTVVSDGCTDGSDDLIDGLVGSGRVPGVHHVRHDRNRGKGAALRTGFAEARTPLVGFIDADGDLPPSLIGTLVSAQQDLDADVVFGSKVAAGSDVRNSAVRTITSVGYRTLIRVLFRLDIPDTQTGVKLYRTAMIASVLPTLREEKFALDLEIFIAARAAGFDTFCAVPVTLTREHGSTISPRTVVRMFNDTMRLLWRSKVGLAYVRSASPAPTRPTSSLVAARTEAR